MTTVRPGTAVEVESPPDPATAVEAARALAPEIRARAREGEQLRTMPPDLANRVEAAALFALWLPRSLGGLELDPASIVRIIEEISYADGSAGWTSCSSTRSRASRTTMARCGGSRCSPTSA